jgi:pyridoxamine 5'-phosphate oxidase
MTTLRDRLRRTPSIVGQPPHFDPQTAPDEPRELFVDWLTAALAADVAEPHALTLSTVDREGRPDARILVLKDVTADGSFEIATGDESAKGKQLDANPHVALTFYWTPLARSIRVRGLAERATPAESASDFRARNPAAKAIAWQVAKVHPCSTPRNETASSRNASHDLSRNPTSRRPGGPCGVFGR